MARIPSRLTKASSRESLPRLRPQRRRHVFLRGECLPLPARNRIPLPCHTGLPRLEQASGNRAMRAERRFCYRRYCCSPSRYCPRGRINHRFSEAATAATKTRNRFQPCPVCYKARRRLQPEAFPVADHPCAQQVAAVVHLAGDLLILVGQDALLLHGELGDVTQQPQPGLRLLLIRLPLLRLIPAGPKERKSHWRCTDFRSRPGRNSASGIPG